MDTWHVVFRLEKLHLIRRILRHKATMDFPIYPGQLQLLEFVKAHKGCTQAEVADHLMITPASVALSTKRMEKSGLLEKRVDTDNLRCKKLYITEKGEQLSLKCREVFNEMDTAMLKGFSDEELHILSGFTDRFLKNLSEHYSYNTEDMDIFSLFAMKNKMNARRKKEFGND